MKRFTGILILTFITTALSAQIEGTALFVSSSPFPAELIVDGVPYPEKTPLLIRSLGPGEHSLTVNYEGYQSKSVAVRLEPGKAEALRLVLKANTFDIAFPAEDSIRLAGTERPAATGVFRFSEGGIRVQRSDSVLRVDPVYPHQEWIDGLSLAIPVAVILTGLLTADAIINPPRSDAAVPPALIITHGLTIGLLGLDVAVNSHKASYFERYPVNETVLTESIVADRQIYNEAEELLAAGEFQGALTRFASIQESSELYPSILYKQSRIHFLLGDDSRAAEGFRRVVEEYPLADLYDRSRKNLADILVRKGDYDEGLNELEAITFWDPFHSREELDVYRCEILSMKYEKISADSPEKGTGLLSEIISSYRQLISRYEESEGLTNFRYCLALYLHKSGADADALEVLDALDLSDVSGFDRERIRALANEISEDEAK